TTNDTAKMLVATTSVHRTADGALAGRNAVINKATAVIPPNSNSERASRSTPRILTLRVATRIPAIHIALRINAGVPSALPEWFSRKAPPGMTHVMPNTRYLLPDAFHP